MDKVTKDSLYFRGVTPSNIRNVESFVRSGNLRSLLEKSGELTDNEIEYLIYLTSSAYPLR